MKKISYCFRECSPYSQPASILRYIFAGNSIIRYCHFFYYVDNESVCATNANTLRKLLRKCFKPDYSIPSRKLREYPVSIGPISLEQTLCQIYHLVSVKFRIHQTETASWIPLGTSIRNSSFVGDTDTASDYRSGITGHSPRLRNSHWIAICCSCSRRKSVIGDDQTQESEQKDNFFHIFIILILRPF